MSVGLVVNPSIARLEAISLMPARSAPSANSLTLGRELIALPFVSLRKFGENSAAGLGQRFYRDIRRVGAPFAVAVFNEEICASDGLSCGHVPPPIAHHEALREVDTEFARGLQEQSGLRLAAIA